MNQLEGRAVRRCTCVAEHVHTCVVYGSMHVIENHQNLEVNSLYMHVFTCLGVADDEHGHGEHDAQGKAGDDAAVVYMKWWVM